MLCVLEQFLGIPRGIREERTRGNTTVGVSICFLTNPACSILGRSTPRAMTSGDVSLPSSSDATREMSGCRMARRARGASSSTTPISPSMLPHAQFEIEPSCIRWCGASIPMCTFPSLVTRWVHVSCLQPRAEPGVASDRGCTRARAVCHRARTDGRSRLCVACLGGVAYWA